LTFVLAGGVLAATGGASTFGKPASGNGQLVRARALAVQHPQAKLRQPPFLTPPGYFAAKAAARTQALSAKPGVTTMSAVDSRSRQFRRTHGAPLLGGNQFFLDQFQFTSNQFGDASSSFFAPPDTQLAAGFNEVVETTNDTMRVYSKGGATLQTNNLTSFFGGASDQTSTDNKVVFDQGADRYYMANLLVNCCDGSGNPTGSQIKLAVSQNSDPTGSWCVYTFGFFTDTSGNVLDQPKLGYSNDKITITENQNGGGSGSLMDVLQKSDVLAGCSSVAGTGFTTNDFNVMPVISLSGTDDQYAVYNNGGSNAHILDITGTPSGGGVSFSDTSKGIAGLNTPPQAAQPPFSGGGTAPIDTSDNRYQSAVYQFGQIWATAGDACNPGDATHACIRVDEFDANNSFNVIQERELNGGSGVDIYMPAISLDSSGDPFFSYTASSSSQFPEMVSGGAILPFGASFPAVINFAGDSTYFCTFCKDDLGNPRPRWGDFSGAARDPNDDSTIWTAAEYGATSSLGQGSDGWSTGISASTFDEAFTSSASPRTGSSGGGTFVDVRGGGFVNGGTTIFFGGVASPDVIFISPEEVFAETPSEAPGHVGVSPQTANGNGPDFTLGFDFQPSVTGLSPNAGRTAGGNSVDITGTGFTGASSVTFGGIAASFTVNNDGDITAVAPGQSAGTVDVRVTTNSETSPTSFSDEYTYDNPPTVTSITPTKGPAGGGNTVTVNGTNFVPGETVRFGAIPSTSVTFVSATQVKAKAPAHTAGTVGVRVVTPGGTSPDVSGGQYTFVPAPTISSLSPNAGPTGGGNTITINGANFTSTATVKFSTTAATAVTFVSTTQLKAKVPAHTAGSVNVRVTTVGGSSPITTADLYGYGAPTLSSLSPNAGSTAGGNTVTINGNGFVPGVTVKFSTTAATTVTFVSNTQIKAKAPAHSAGNVNIRVTSAAGTSIITNASQYAFGAPAVSSVSPHSGTTAGGTTVTIDGARFVPGAIVKFGTTASTSVTFVASNQIKAKAPAHTAGTVNITVTTGGGTSPTSTADHYTYS
jgi:hypothetical protein